jgi:hypothetical protein
LIEYGDSLFAFDLDAILAWIHFSIEKICRVFLCEFSHRYCVPVLEIDAFCLCSIGICGRARRRTRGGGWAPRTGRKGGED